MISCDDCGTSGPAVLRFFTGEPIAWREVGRRHLCPTCSRRAREAAGQLVLDLEVPS
jgi:hypothetical protein